MIWIKIIHEGLSSDGESESVPILKFLSAVGQKINFSSFFMTKTLSILMTDFNKNALEGLSSDGESESVLILKFFLFMVGQKIDYFEIFLTKMPITLLFFVPGKNNLPGTMS